MAIGHPPENPPYQAGFFCFAQAAAAAGFDNPLTVHSRGMVCVATISLKITGGL
jgi:hypothetical protein